MNTKILSIFAVAMFATAVLAVMPVSVNAGPLDEYFFIGKWSFEDSDEEGSAKFTVIFKPGGEGTYIFEFTHGEETESEESDFEWKIEDDKIFIKEGDSEEWPEEGQAYEFSSGYTKLKVGDMDDYEFEKQGGTAAVCCPFLFTIIGLPAFALIGALAIFGRRK